MFEVKKFLFHEPYDDRTWSAERIKENWINTRPASEQLNIFLKSDAHIKPISITGNDKEMFLLYELLPST